MSRSILRLVHARGDEPSVRPDLLASTLAATKVLDVIERSFKSISEWNAEDVSEPALRKGMRKMAAGARSYFREQGVVFDGRGRPQLPSGSLRKVDLTELYRRASTLAVNGFLLGMQASELDEALFSSEVEEIQREEWNASSQYVERVSGERVVAVVVALNLVTLEVGLRRYNPPFAKVPDTTDWRERLSSVLCTQRPKGWAPSARPCHASEEPGSPAET